MWRTLYRAMLMSLVVSSMVTVGFAERPRVVISTDIGGSDNDDFQSMVHLLVYADVFDIEGLISSPTGKGRASHIAEVLQAYKVDYPKLSTYGPYPTYEALLSVTAQGAINGGAPGSGKNTDGSELIIATASVSEARPLWILVWGARYKSSEGIYRTSFTKVGPKPNSVTVISNGGGADTESVP